MRSSDLCDTHLHTPDWSGCPPYASDKIFTQQTTHAIPEAEAPFWLHSLCQQVLGAELEALPGVGEQPALTATGTGERALNYHWE